LAERIESVFPFAPAAKGAPEPFFGDFQCAKRAKSTGLQNGLLLPGILSIFTPSTQTPFYSDNKKDIRKQRLGHCE
jgi:hypothetical protein